MAERCRISEASAKAVRAVAKLHLENMNTAFSADIRS